MGFCRCTLVYTYTATVLLVLLGVTVGAEYHWNNIFMKMLHHRPACVCLQTKMAESVSEVELVNFFLLQVVLQILQQVVLAVIAKILKSKVILLKSKVM